MSKQIYSWKRFWCPRSGSINLADGGYLPDPDEEWGRACNSGLVSFEAIADLPCLVLLGEAGMGKTTAIETAHKEVYDRTKDSEDVCLRFKLGDYGSDTELCSAIFRNDAFQAWRQGSHKLHLFLDSLDEGVLSIKILVRILKREIENLPCDRLYLRITCRTAEWAFSLEEKLEEKWGKDNVSVYEIAPLRRADVIEAASKNNINSDEFLQEIFNRNAIPLAIKPVTLNFLLDIYAEKRQFPASQEELYEKGCLQLCEEINPDRCEAGFKGKLSAKKRRVLAGRIAAVMLFSNRVAVWTSPECRKIPDSDISLQDLCTGKEKADEQNFDVDEDCIREVFAISSLFSAQGSNHRTGFAHRTYAEFLAAWYLKQHNLNLLQILSLILHPDDRVILQLQETTAWLASMIPEVFQEIMKTDPDVLLQSDISTINDENKAKLVESLLRLHNEEKLKHSWFLRYNNLDYPGLPEQLESYIRDSSKNQWSRLVAIFIAQDCNVKSVQGSLADIALDPAQLYIVRTHAARTVCVIGDEETKKRLKPLAVGEAGDDPDDDLKGRALRAVWPQHISVEDLLDHLSQPKQKGAFPIIGGAYQDFIATEFAEHLRPSDLPVTLKWLKQLPQRYDLHYPFRELADSVILKAWQNLDEPGVLEAFANVAILRLKQDDGILGDRPYPEYTRESLDRTRDADVEPFLRDSDEKRRQLIEAIVSLISESESDFLWLTNIICSEDVVWIIERITSAESPRITDVWVKLLRQALKWHNLYWKNAKHNDAILEARSISSIMRLEFETEIELGSEKAQQVQASYLQDQNLLRPSGPEPTLDPSPKQRVLTALEKIEAGQPQLWWQIIVEMTLIPTSQEYIHDHIFESDITRLPGWKEAEANTKARIIKTAKNYLDAGDPETQQWLGTNNFSHPPFAGYQALYLLVKQQPDFISKISINTWIKWIPIILKSVNLPHRNTETKEDNVCREMVRTAYQSAPDELIETLISFMAHNNYQPRTFYRKDVYRLMNELLDQCLASLIFARVSDENLNAGMLEILLTDLFKHDVDKAKEIAKSFLIPKLPESARIRDKAIVAARLLLANYPDNSSWSVFWSAVQQDYEFGRVVLESIAFQAAPHDQIEQKIKEDYLAELYVFLTQQYPEVDQPEPETQERRGVEAQILGEFDMVRMWKNSIPQRLQSRGTPEACDALRKIIRELPEQKDQLQPTLFEAERLARRNTWKPPKPKDLLQIALHQDKRFVQDGHQLLNVLIESLERLELELQGETPACRDLWDKDNDNDNLFRPIDENAFSDYVKRFLDKELKSRHIIVNREVEIRRSYGGNTGERTDIHVDAVLKNLNDDTDDSITVIVEVKGCWHPKLLTAMQSQLSERYLSDNVYPYGLYLVGWFNCKQWDDKDSRKKQTPKKNLDEIRAQLAEQAQHLTSSTNIVRAYVLNTALR